MQCDLRSNPQGASESCSDTVDTFSVQGGDTLSLLFYECRWRSERHYHNHAYLQLRRMDLNLLCGEALQIRRLAIAEWLHLSCSPGAKIICFWDMTQRYFLLTE
jgi:hypothetical protein